MTTYDLLQRMYVKLGEQTRFYTPEEMVLNGLNPAQRLLTRVYPQLLPKRRLLTVTADLPFYDLRLLDPQLSSRRVWRVVLGDVTTDAPTPSVASGELHDLTRTTVTKLAYHRDWLNQRGPLEHFWTWGTHWLGLYKRPVYAASVTVIYGAVPTPLNVDIPTGVPDIIGAYHPLLSDVATALVLAKEGGVEGQRALATIANALGG